jgi:regulator of sigma E protease
LGDLFPNQWNWYAFWQITAFLSVILAFMNIIPIPALDGGYTLFLIVEMITRRKPSERFLEIANTIGMGFLFLLLLYANGNDIYRLFIK